MDGLAVVSVDRVERLPGGVDDLGRDRRVGLREGIKREYRRSDAPKFRRRDADPDQKAWPMLK
jgi:hypothetical protein